MRRDGNPFCLLGYVGRGCHKRCAFWSGVIERLKARLCRWKCIFLSLVERIYLIKYVLSSIPLFYLSLIKMRFMVANEIMRIQRNFLWGWGANKRKVVWDSWSKVCESRKVGGLGILDLRVFNTALLGKWIWRLRTDKDGLWKEVLESKYGGWRSLREGVKNSRVSLVERLEGGLEFGGMGKEFWKCFQVEDWQWRGNFLLGGLLGG